MSRSQENVEIARHAMSGMEPYWDLLDEYVVCDYRSYRLLDAPEVDFGRAAVIDMTRRYWGTFEAYSVEAEEYADLGQSVFVAIRERGRGKGSGVPIDRRMGWLWTFRNGKIVRMEGFRTKQEALEAVGLSE